MSLCTFGWEIKDTFTRSPVCVGSDPSCPSLPVQWIIQATAIHPSQRELCVCRVGSLRGQQTRRCQSEFGTVSQLISLCAIATLSRRPVCFSLSLSLLICQCVWLVRPSSVVFIATLSLHWTFVARLSPSLGSINNLLPHWLSNLIFKQSECTFPARCDSCLPPSSGTHCLSE